MNESANILSKEQIKERILHNISRFWQADSAEIDSFDPILNLLVEVNANEAYRIYHEVENSHKRILKKLARLLVPDQLTGPQPAYAIMHAEPTDTFFNLRPDYQFFVSSVKTDSIQKTNSEQSNETFFSPSGHFKLWDAQILFFINSISIYQISENNHFKQVINFKTFPEITHNILFLGIKLNREIVDAEGLSFYFEWKSKTGVNLFYDLLKQVKFFLNGNAININKNLEYKKSHVLLKNQFDTTTYLENFVNRLYEKHFFSFPSLKKEIADLQQALKFFPAEIDSAINQNEKQLFTEELLWLKLEFPTMINNPTPESLYINTNCFPVINRRLNEMHYRVQPWLNIIPMTVDEHYLCIKSVQNQDGYQYVPSYNDANETEKGTYDIREGGVERFDSRNAKQHLAYLIELLRDESAAFTIYGREFVSALIRNFNQNIAELEQKLKLTENQIKETPAYLVLNPKNPGENVFIEYWSTNGQAGNNLYSGTKLNPLRGSEIVSDSCYLVTHTSGGRNALNEKEILKSFKYALLSGDRIISKSDIINFVKSELQDMIQKVHVETGAAAAENSIQGLKKFIFIYLTPSENFVYKTTDWDNRIKDLKLKLENKSAIGFNYRIMVNSLN